MKKNESGPAAAAVLGAAVLGGFVLTLALMAACALAVLMGALDAGQIACGPIYAWRSEACARLPSPPGARLPGSPCGGLPRAACCYPAGGPEFFMVLASRRSPPRC